MGDDKSKINIVLGLFVFLVDGAFVHYLFEEEDVFLFVFVLSLEGEAEGFVVDWFGKHEGISKGLLDEA